MQNRTLFIIYIVLCILEVLGTYFEVESLIFATKPLLMPTLFLWFLMSARVGSKFRNLILISIFFAFLGDTFLLFVPYNELFFLLGLGAFLFGQLLYGVGFINNINHSTTRANLKMNLLFALFFVGVYIFLMSTLWSHLGDFLIPVVVYGFTICFMGLMAAFRWGRVGSDSFSYIFVGALTFVVSDSVIAIDKFLYAGKFPNAQVIIMITYCIAQFLIVKGSLLYLKEEK